MNLDEFRGSVDGFYLSKVNINMPGTMFKVKVAGGTNGLDLVDIQFDAETKTLYLVPQGFQKPARISASLDVKDISAK